MPAVVHPASSETPPLARRPRTTSSYVHRRNLRHFIVYFDGMKVPDAMIGATVINACHPVLVVENDEIIIGPVMPVTAIMGVKVVVVVVVVVARSSSFHGLICLSPWSLLRPMRLSLMRAILLLLLSLHPPPPLLLPLLLHRLQPRMMLTIPRKKRLRRRRRQEIRRR